MRTARRRRCCSRRSTASTGDESEARSRDVYEHALELCRVDGDERRALVERGDDPRGLGAERSARARRARRPATARAAPAPRRPPAAKGRGGCDEPFEPRGLEPNRSAVRRGLLAEVERPALQAAGGDPDRVSGERRSWLTACRTAVLAASLCRSDSAPPQRASRRGRVASSLTTTARDHEHRERDPVLGVGQRQRVQRRQEEEVERQHRDGRKPGIGVCRPGGTATTTTAITSRTPEAGHQRLLGIMRTDLAPVTRPTATRRNPRGEPPACRSAPAFSI